MKLLEGWTRPGPENEFDVKQMRLIDEHGWALIGVFDPEGEEPNFVYSSGIIETLGAPEIIVFGLKLDTLKWLCNAYGGLVRDGKPVEPGVNHDGIIDGFPVRFIAADSGRNELYGEYLRWTHWYYGRRDFPVYQLVWPDAQGCFPWDPECDEHTRRDQPLLGPLTN